MSQKMPVYANLILIVLLLVGFGLRAVGVDWDGYRHYHPDERYIAWVATSVEFSGHESAADLLNPQTSRLNPFYWPNSETTDGIVVPTDEPRHFAYGHVPLYLGVLATRVTELFPALLEKYLEWNRTQPVVADFPAVEFIYLTAVARTFTALIDTFTIGAVFLLGKRLFNWQIGLTAAGFLTFNVMHIQLSHFFASDPYMTLFVVSTILCLVTALLRHDRNELVSVGHFSKPMRMLLLGAAVTGLAVGSKFSAIMLGLPLLIVAVSFGRSKLPVRLALILIVFVASFAMTNPFVFLDNSCDVVSTELSTVFGQLPIDIDNCYLDNIVRQNTMVQGSGRFPFTRQYAFTVPFLYPIEMQIRWGMGSALGIVAFISAAAWVGLAAWRSLHAVRGSETFSALDLAEQQKWLAGLVILGWCLPYFISTANFYVKFMRYMQPLVPFLMLFAAWGLWSIPQRRMRQLALTVVLLPTVAFAMAFVNIYRAPHPWIATSQWIFDEVPAGSTVAVELWDEALPSSLVVNGERLNRRDYALAEMNWLSGSNHLDHTAKLEENLEQLASADYLTVASNRSYGVIPRLPIHYPTTNTYYDLLFAGELGFEIVYIVDRSPNLGGVYIVPDTFAWPNLDRPDEVTDYFSQRTQWLWARADESFTVYDQPLTIVLINRDRLTPAEMLAKFDDP